MTIGRIPSVEGGIQPTIVDAKGDLIAATAADTVNRLAVGSNDQVLVADSSTSTGLAWKSVATPFAAGKNKIINGDFNINQRAFTSTTTDDLFTLDRWRTRNVDGTVTCSVEPFTLGTAPVTGYESKSYARIVTTGQTLSSARASYNQRMESVRTFANQTITVSFWAKSASGTPSIAPEFVQNFGTGGSPSSAVVGIISSPAKQAISTTWTRYSFTMNVPSISGKTLGTNDNDYFELLLWVSAGSTFDSRTGTLGIQSNTFDIWGVQVEAGSVATAFQTATGTLQGELAACQRYYYRITSTASYGILGRGYASDANSFQVIVPLKTTMRVTPTALDTSATSTFYYEGGVSGNTPTSVTLGSNGNPNEAQVIVTKASTFTAGQGQGLYGNNNTAAYIGLTAEL